MQPNLNFDWLFLAVESLRIKKQEWLVFVGKLILTFKLVFLPFEKVSFVSNKNLVATGSLNALLSEHSIVICE